MPPLWSRAEGKLKLEISAKGRNYKLELEGTLDDIVSLTIKNLRNYRDEIGVVAEQ